MDISWNLQCSGNWESTTGTEQEARELTPFHVSSVCCKSWLHWCLSFAVNFAVIPESCTSVSKCHKLNSLQMKLKQNFPEVQVMTSSYWLVSKREDVSTGRHPIGHQHQLFCWAFSVLHLCVDFFPLPNSREQECIFILANKRNRGAIFQSFIVRCLCKINHSGLKC